MARINPPECELENIVVADTHRRHGLAARLLKQLITAARERDAEQILLEVRESNLPALSLYRKLGFSMTGRRTCYYRDPNEDAVLFTLLL